MHVLYRVAGEDASAMLCCTSGGVAVLYMMPCYLLVVVAVAFMGAGSSGSVLLTAARA